jgi:hypothetical protein
MFVGRFSFVLAGLLAAVCPLIAQGDSPASLPVTDNQAAPYMGVYETALGTKQTDAFAAWLHRTRIWGQDTIPFGQGSTWNHISGTYDDWFYKPWSDWVRAQPGRRMVLSIPLLPGPPDGKGPAEGPGAGLPVSLAEGAAGKYDAYFKGLAQTLVQYHLGDSILRLGWEWNGNWYAWKVVTADDARNFAAYWRRIVTAIRSVPGTENLKFDWNVSNGFKTSYDASLAYPGDDVVDYIGVDLYDSCWAKYPASSSSDLEALHREVWADYHLAASNYGLAYWQKIADDHGKPMTFPEWGVDKLPNGHGGLDDPYFIEQAFNYFHDPAHHVYFESYFDCDAGDAGDSRISDISGKPTFFPKSSARMKELFTVP